MLAERLGFSVSLRRRAAATAPEPKPCFYAFRSPLGYPLMANTVVEMVERLSKERAFCEAERTRGRGCPAPFPGWDAVLAAFDAKIAELEGLS